jgi:hypothetical protein
MIISGWILPRMINISDKSCRENHNIHFMFNNFFVFRKSCLLWSNVVKYGRARQAVDDNITRRTRMACWITKATDMHSEYAIVVSFPLQQWLHERVSMLRHSTLPVFFSNYSRSCVCTSDFLATDLWAFIPAPCFLPVLSWINYPVLDVLNNTWRRVQTSCLLIMHFSAFISHIVRFKPNIVISSISV